MRFYGNQVCCGSYACLNAIKAPDMDPLLFELSTGAPFGVKHCENAQFDRLLTTLHNPNEGLDPALCLWGCHTETFQAHSSQEAIGLLQSRLPHWGSAVVGPVDMGGLAYQVMPGLLRRMDHYISLEHYSARDVLCTDSEGFSQLMLSYEQLQRCLSVENVPEAAGNITLRFLEKAHGVNLDQVLTYSFSQAARHLQEGEQTGQGSFAIYRCCAFLTSADRFRWKLPFLYDLEYLGQRKQLFLLLLDTAEHTGFLKNTSLCSLRQMIGQQIEQINTVYQTLRWQSRLDSNALRKAGDLERSLAESMSSYL